MKTDLMDSIEETSSRIEKENLLKGADDETKRILAYALDPYRTYGVTLNRSVALREFDQNYNLSNHHAPYRWWTIFTKLLDRLAERQLTGGEATLQLMAHFAQAPNNDVVEWGLRVLNKKLRCGVSSKTLMKVFPGLIQPFEVALAQSFDAKKHKLHDVGYIEPKLDGLRVTVVDGVARTRNGNEVSATDAMLGELASFLGCRNARLRDWVFDGEFIGDGTFEDTVSKARKSGKENRGLVYNVFDMVSRDEWTSRQTRKFSERRRDVEDHISLGRFVRPVLSIRQENPTLRDLFGYRDKFIEDGFEGAMWKADEPYMFKRSSALLKLKKWETVDAKIVGVEVGQGKYEGLLGALVVSLDDGTKVNVGSGYSDAQRENFWSRRTMLKGKTIEIQYQNMTSKGSLRFPVFVKFRSDLS